MNCENTHKENVVSFVTMILLIKKIYLEKKAWENKLYKESHNNKQR